ncbi:MAG TPA: phosphatase PAP2 family protein [Nitrospirota bacterium]|nr:phosphatase PAP2 family protein [Nitrospirota bacterium]
MRSPLKPVDLLSLSLIALLSVVAVVFSRSVPSWGWLIARYALLALVIVSVALYTFGSQSGKLALSVHAFLPVFIIPVIFDSLGDLIPSIWPRYLDDILIHIDRGLFGVNPTVWMERFIHPMLTNFLQLAYISYYFIPISLGIVLAARKKQNNFDEAIFGIVLCFYLSYIGYLLFPAIGPRFTLGHLQTTGFQASPMALAIQNTLNRLENTKTDAFPSGHTAVALMTLYYAWKSREKVLFWTLIPVVSSLVISTVYLRYHYVIDVIAGVLLSTLTIYLAPRVNKALSPSSEKSHG